MDKYYVVEGSEKPWIAICPVGWYSADLGGAFFPPVRSSHKAGDTARRASLIRSCAKHDVNKWELHACSILKACKNYERAVKAVARVGKPGSRENLATTDAEDLGKGKRVRIPNRRFEFDSLAKKKQTSRANFKKNNPVPRKPSGTSTDDEENPAECPGSTSSRQGTYSIPGIEPLDGAPIAGISGLSIREKTVIRDDSSSSSDTEMDCSDVGSVISIPPAHCETRAQDAESCSQAGGAAAQFDQQGVKALVELAFKKKDEQKCQLALAEKMEKLSNILVNAVDERRRHRLNRLGKLSLPLASLKQFQEAEAYLLTSAENRENVLEELLDIGGFSAGDVVRRVMRRVLTTELARNFSWYGKKNNKPLFQTEIGKIILCVAKANVEFKMTEAKGIFHISNWLRHAKDNKQRAARQTAV